MNYNKNMGGVGRKWWKYVFWGMLNIAIINVYIVWGTLQRLLLRNHRRWSLKAFRMQLVQSLCDSYSGRKQRAKSLAPGVCGPSCYTSFESRPLPGEV